MLIVFATWLVSFGVYYFAFIQNNTNEEGMVNWWSHHNAFLRLDSLSWTAKFFYGHFIILILGLLPTFSLYNTVIALLIAAGLFAVIKRKNYSLLILIIAPIVIHILLSSIKLYPFYPRLYLYI